MTALLFPVFNYVRDNTWAQVVVLLGFGFVVLKIRDKIRDRRTTQRVEARIEKRSRKTQKRIEGELNEKSQQVADARASAPSGITASEQLPEHLRSIIISD